MRTVPCENDLDPVGHGSGYCDGTSPCGIYDEEAVTQLAWQLLIVNHRVNRISPLQRPVGQEAIGALATARYLTDRKTTKELLPVAYERSWVTD